jgi:uncharacterized YigZ family protein
VTDPFRTVAGRGESGFEIRGSEFLGHVAPARTVEAAESFVADVGEAYDDATHVVPAYRVRADPLRAWASDDGEPSGSAGEPALNVLEREALENVAAAVVRYYGGTNLGVGGLARAYGRAVKEALDDAGIVERRPRERVSVTVDYDDSGTVRGILEGADAEFEATYEERVHFAVDAPADAVARLCDRLRSATGGRVEIDVEGRP